MADMQRIVTELTEPERQALLTLGSDTDESEPLSTDLIDSLESRGLVDFRPSEAAADLTELGRRVYQALTNA